MEFESAVLRFLVRSKTHLSPLPLSTEHFQSKFMTAIPSSVPIPSIWLFDCHHSLFLSWIKSSKSKLIKIAFYGSPRLQLTFKIALKLSSAFCIIYIFSVFTVPLHFWAVAGLHELLHLCENIKISPHRCSGCPWRRRTDENAKRRGMEGIKQVRKDKNDKRRRGGGAGCQPQ